MLPTLLTTTDKARYEQYLSEKITRVFGIIKQELSAVSTNHNINLVQELDELNYEVHASLPEHYRMRCEFAIYHYKEGHFDYIMYEPKTKPRKKIIIKDFPGCTVSINQAMEAFRQYAPSFKNITKKLFASEFLCNQAGNIVITLHYHKKLDDIWQKDVESLCQKFTQDNLKISVVGRAKKQKFCCGDDYVIESIQTKNKLIKLQQIEGTFSQPNATACTAMLNFAIECSEQQQESDLLELYCGSGTFTVTLAPYYRKVFATEVSRVPTQTALFNMQLNNITNLKIARLSALEVTEALQQTRVFNRLKEQDIDLSTYHFNTLLIDPPRAGLQDEAALKFTAQYDRVIYISCGPESLAKDLAYLTKTHKISRLAFFDQFPYTDHLESGVLLERRKN